MQKTKEQRVHEVFEKISDNYDQMNSVISFQQHNKWRNDTMHKMQVPKGAACIDVCCGTADWTIALGEAVGPTGTVVGLDFSQNMLNVGHGKTAHMPQIELVQGNAMALPYPDNSFDFATIGFGLRCSSRFSACISVSSCRCSARCSRRAIKNTHGCRNRLKHSLACVNWPHFSARSVSLK